MKGEKIMYQEEMNMIDSQNETFKINIEKQNQQLQSENQKLMNYISSVREEQKKKSFWNKLFYK